MHCFRHFIVYQTRWPRGIVTSSLMSGCSILPERVHSPRCNQAENKAVLSSNISLLDMLQIWNHCFFHPSKEFQLSGFTHPYNILVWEVQPETSLKGPENKDGDESWQLPVFFCVPSNVVRDVPALSYFILQWMHDVGAAILCKDKQTKAPKLTKKTWD